MKAKMSKGMDSCRGVVRRWGEGLGKASRRRYYFIGTSNDLFGPIKGRTNWLLGGNESDIFGLATAD